jgi:hypothetical protein
MEQHGCSLRHQLGCDALIRSISAIGIADHLGEFLPNGSIAAIRRTTAGI